MIVSVQGSSITGHLYIIESSKYGDTRCFKKLLFEVLIFVCLFQFTLVLIGKWVLGDVLIFRFEFVMIKVKK